METRASFTYCNAGIWANKENSIKQGSLSFLFTFRGQFSQQFSHFHFSLILYSCLVATVHHFCISHLSSVALALPLSIPQIPSTCSPVPGCCLPLHHSYVCPCCTLCLPSLSATCSPNPILPTHRLPAIHQMLPIASHSIIATYPLSCHTVPYHTIPYHTHLPVPSPCLIPSVSYSG